MRASFKLNYAGTICGSQYAVLWETPIPTPAACHLHDAIRSSGKKIWISYRSMAIEDGTPR